MELDKAMTDFLQQQGIFYKMFDVIRLVEQDGHYICKYLSDGSCTVTHENCYSFWGRDHRCSNCVSRQAYNENRQHVKFEYAHGKYYFVMNLIHELERVSSRDPFTGLYNKNTFLIT